MDEANRIGNIIKDRNIILKGADLITSGGGFTQVPNFLLTSKEISVGAKLTYAMLLKYAWANDECFPGQETLAEDMGAGERSVRRFLQELQQVALLKVKRRGQGRSNIYELNLTVKKKS